MDEAAFTAALATLPGLKESAEADWDKSTGKFKKVRTAEDQLSKLLANLDRLRLREKRGEGTLTTEINSRKAQVKKLRKNGIVPSPGLCVFAQIDFDKRGYIKGIELKNMLKGLTAVYKVKAGVDEIMKTLDEDASGEIDENEWCENLDKLPELKAALQSDLDPDTGRLKSFRSPRQTFAKLLANIDRLEYDASKGKDVQAELDSRRKEANRYRDAGYDPSAGVLVFEQLDKKKTGKVNVKDIADLIKKLKYEEKSADEIIAKLDVDSDKSIDQQEWLDGLDGVPSFKIALEKDIERETGKLKCLIDSGKAIFDMLRRQEGQYNVDKNEVGRLLKAVNTVYKPTDADIESKCEELIAAGKDKMSPEEWLVFLDTLPDLKAKLEADYVKSRIRFTSFRSCGQMLSKLLGNLDRLRLKEAAGEDVAEMIATRKSQVKKMRTNGILPSPALSVFNQIDIDKSGTVSIQELKRLFYSLRKVYPASVEEIEKMLSTMDTDSDGEIDEVEWVRNLAKLPALKTALMKDIDPDTGRLRSYRSKEDQLAKLLGNVERLEYDIAKGDDPDGANSTELESRKAQAAKMREANIVPSAGIVVFNQIDKKKERKIAVGDLKELMEKLSVPGKSVEDVFAKLDQDSSALRSLPFRSVVP
jgi:Ca2+-binding EF-hand superfamily protein